MFTSDLRPVPPLSLPDAPDVLALAFFGDHLAAVTADGQFRAVEVRPRRDLTAGFLSG